MIILGSHLELSPSLPRLQISWLPPTRFRVGASGCHRKCFTQKPFGFRASASYVQRISRNAEGSAPIWNSSAGLPLRNLCMHRAGPTDARIQYSPPKVRVAISETTTNLNLPNYINGVVFVTLLNSKLF